MVKSHSNSNHLILDHHPKNMDILRYRSPAIIAITGSTGSGKTRHALQLIKYIDAMFDRPVVNIIYCYAQYQTIFAEIERTTPNISFHLGLPDEEVLSKCSEQVHSVLFLDDLMEQITQDKQALLLFTQISHHKCVSLVYLNQNIYHQGKNSTTLTRNIHYHILMRSPCMGQQIISLGKQLYPGKGQALMEAYNDSTKSELYSYLLVDLSPHSEDQYRLRTNIFPEQTPIVYIPH